MFDFHNKKDIEMFEEIKKNETYTIFGSVPIFVGIDPVNAFPFTSINSTKSAMKCKRYIYIIHSFLKKIDKCFQRNVSTYQLLN